jgi:hypothetical protein
VQKVKSLSFWVKETLPCNDRASFDFPTDMNVNLVLLWKGSYRVKDSLVITGQAFFDSSSCAAGVEPALSLSGEVSRQQTLGFHEARGSLVFAGLTNVNQSNQISHHGFVNKIVDKLVEETLPWNDRASFDCVNHNLMEEY